MKIIVDTSVWIDHLKKANPALQAKLEELEVLTHPAIILELALGQIKNRQEFLGYLQFLPSAVEASVPEITEGVEKNKLYGMGLSAIDAFILSSALLSDAAIATRDQTMLKAMKILKIQAADL